MNVLDEQYWASRWANNQVGWDIGKAAPAIMQYFEINRNINKSILIPGCGNAYEAIALWDLGYTDITVLEIVQSKADELRTRFADTDIKVIHEDFFNLYTSFDIIIEHTFFCALNPQLRTKYVHQMHRLLNDGGELVGLLFNRAFEQAGPPFGGDINTYRSLFSATFKNVSISPCNQSIAPRIGSEVWLSCKK